LVIPAQWQRHGRAAGPIRNRELLEQAIARAVAHTPPPRSSRCWWWPFPVEPVRPRWFSRPAA
jgi:hypothetical protein